MITNEIFAFIIMPMMVGLLGLFMFVFTGWLDRRKPREVALKRAYSTCSFG